MDDLMTAPVRRGRMYGDVPGAARHGELSEWLDRHRHRAIAIAAGVFRVRGRTRAVTVYHDADGHLVVETADHYHFPRDLEDLGRILRAAGVR
jgi:hypothetical protein